jgi:hypothetical protein
MQNTTSALHTIIDCGGSWPDTELICCPSIHARQITENKVFVIVIFKLSFMLSFHEVDEQIYQVVPFGKGVLFTR